MEETILNGLDYAKTDRSPFIRALKNLKRVTTIPVLIKLIRSGNHKESALAFLALKHFKNNEEINRVALRAFWQLDRKYDTTSRTLAADILLESDSESILSDFLQYLKTNESSYEVKQYVWQHIKMLADDNHVFEQKIWDFIKKDKELNNYATLSPKGLSTALKRYFLKSPSANASFVSIQEMSGGLVKRGVVNVVMEKNNQSKELFSVNYNTPINFFFNKNRFLVGSFCWRFG